MNSFNYDLASFLPFRDKEVCERVRRIKKEDLPNHPNPDFKIRIIEEPQQFYLEFALDIVRRIKESLEAGKRLVVIFPVGPMLPE